MKTLILIPARAGSKGLPGKNVKLLGNLPLISHTVLFAKEIQEEGDIICVSTDDDSVIEIVKGYNISIPFKRPSELATDKAGTYDVILHALAYYESVNIKFDAVLLMQPTSPLRKKEDYCQLKQKFDSQCDMVVTVKAVKENPYFTLFEESNEGYLEVSKKGNFKTRQEIPPVYAYNGSMYLMRETSIKKSNLVGFEKIIKLLMPEERSVDIDTMADWVLAEFFLNNFNK